MMQLSLVPLHDFHQLSMSPGASHYALRRANASDLLEGPPPRTEYRRGRSAQRVCVVTRAHDVVSVSTGWGKRVHRENKADSRR